MQSPLKIIEYIGNKQLLSEHKIAFLCSRIIPASAVLKCYDWAIEQRKKEKCIISGFHSQIEKEVFEILLKGQQPLILALARGIGRQTLSTFAKPLNEGRVLIITPYKRSVTRVTQQTAMIRNRLMIENAEELVIGHASTKGQISLLLGEMKDLKTMHYL